MIVENSEHLETMRVFLRQFLQEHEAQLKGIIHSYIIRGNVAFGEAARVVAQEVFHEAIVEALAHADRLDATMQPHSWFLSISVNIIRRRRASQARHYKHEVSLSDLEAGSGVGNEGEMFDLIMKRTASSPEQLLEVQEQVNEILALVSAKDAHILHLAIIDNVHTELLAQKLGVQPGTARVRLHRALQRLRAAWWKREVHEKQGEKDV